MDQSVQLNNFKITIPLPIQFESPTPPLQAYEKHENNLSCTIGGECNDGGEHVKIVINYTINASWPMANKVIRHYTFFRTKGIKLYSLPGRRKMFLIILK